MISVEISEKADSRWNKRLLETGLGTIFQTEERSKLLELINGKTIFLKFIDSKGSIVGQVLLEESSRFPNNNSKSKFFKSIPGLKKKSFSWTYGPIIFEKNDSVKIYSALNDFLISEKAVPNAWSHPIYSGEPSIMKKKFQVIDWGTYLIDLTKSTDELYQNIDKSNGRKNIERSKKRGVEIEQITENNLDDFFDLVLKSRTFSTDEEHERKVLHLRWNIFKPLGFSGFLAKKSGMPVGGLLFSYLNGHIIEAGVARSIEDSKEKLYSQDLIKWNIIEWGSKNNMKFFNLAGFNPNPKSEKEIGIQKYKKKWGGQPYSFHRILSKPAPWKKKV
jgi:lipid II:glycine glycyltransferase (peptidoglycan interpeptide bridge formation enzyme)